MRIRNSFLFHKLNIVDTCMRTRRSGCNKEFPKYTSFKKIEIDFFLTRQSKREGNVSE